MNKINFLHISDIHLDTPFTGFSKDNKSELRRDDIKKTFRKIIGTCREKDIDYIFITGDLYEHEYITSSTLQFINGIFRSIDKIKIIMISGNHDPYTNDSKYRNYSWNDNVYVLSAENKSYTDNEINISGMGFKNFMDAEYTLDMLPGIDREKINILLMHGTVDERLSDDRYNLISVEELDNLNMDYIGLGHYHRYFGSLGKRKNIFNPGSPEPLGFDEAFEHGVIMGTIEKDDSGSIKLLTEFIRSGEKEYSLENIDIDKISCDDDIISYINNIKEKKNKICRFILSGYVKQNEYIPDLQYIRSQISEEYFYIRIIDNTKPEYDYENLSKTDGIKGVFIRKLLRLIEEENDEKKRERYEKALYYGLEALENNISIKDKGDAYENQ